jgi:hypothetical protein
MTLSDLNKLLQVALSDAVGSAEIAEAIQHKCVEPLGRASLAEAVGAVLSLRKLCKERMQ